MQVSDSPAVLWVNFGSAAFIIRLSNLTEVNLLKASIDPVVSDRST
jgi:hypothetical protein